MLHFVWRPQLLVLPDSEFLDLTISPVNLETACHSSRIALKNKSKFVRLVDLDGFWTIGYGRELPSPCRSKKR